MRVPYLIESVSGEAGRGKCTKRLRTLILNDCDVCGKAVTEEEKAMEDNTMKCAKIGCETVWVRTSSVIECFLTDLGSSFTGKDDKNGYIVWQNILIRTMWGPAR